MLLIGIGKRRRRSKKSYQQNGSSNPNKMSSNHRNPQEASEDDESVSTADSVPDLEEPGVEVVGGRENPQDRVVLHQGRQQMRSLMDNMNRMDLRVQRQEVNVAGAEHRALQVAGQILHGLTLNVPTQKNDRNDVVAIHGNYRMPLPGWLANVMSDMPYHARLEASRYQRYTDNSSVAHVLRRSELGETRLMGINASALGWRNRLLEQLAETQNNPQNVESDDDEEVSDQKVVTHCFCSYAKLFDQFMLT